MSDDAAGPPVRWRIHAAAGAWFLLVGVVSLLPALLHGLQLGDFGLLRHYGLMRTPGTPLHNAVSADQIQELIPWTRLDWTQVHQGHLPLWNPYAGLGLPLAFNFQSAPFSLPVLVSYLAPASLSYTVVVVMKLLIAGSGGYACARALGRSTTASLFVGTAFELSGALSAWLGWPITGVSCWTGWLFAAMVLVIRGRRHWRNVALLAVVLALSFLGGHPEMSAITIAGTGLAAVAILVATPRSAAALRSRVAAAGRLAAGGIAGAALAAPFLIPGLQVVARSSRTSVSVFPVLPRRDLLHLAFATFDGDPVTGNVYLGPLNFYEEAAWVGVGVLVLALLAVVVNSRRPDVIALACVTLAATAVVFSPTVAHLLGSLPALRTVQWQRSLVMLDFALCVLAGFGLDNLIRDGGAPMVRRTFLACAAAACAAVAAVDARTLLTHTLSSPVAVHERRMSLIGPSIAAAATLAAAVAMALRHRSAGRDRDRSWGRRVTVALVVGGELVFLLTAARGVWSSSNAGFTPTAATARLMRIVGTERVGMIGCGSFASVPDLGILTEANSAYGVREFIAYDPVVPRSYATSWARSTGTDVPDVIVKFCPSISTASLARRYGVAWVLAPSGTPVPAGMRVDAVIDDELVLAVPGSSVTSFAPDGTPDGAPEIPLADRSTDPSTVRVAFSAARPGTLHVHVTDEPGWNATIDGRPLPLHPYLSTMLEAAIPAGRHVVVVTYRPAAFDWGLIVALCAAAVLVAGWAWERRKAP